MGNKTVSKEKKGTRSGRIPTIICIVVTVIAAAGLVLGYVTGNILWAVTMLLPATVYQVIRTEGVSTRWASWVMLILLVATIVLVIFNVNYDLQQLFGQEEAYVAGHVVPLGDVKMVLPTVMAICAAILLVRTRGRFTRWLGIVIFVSSALIIYLIAPETIQYLLRLVSRQAI
jgi:hypothetical protein